MLTRRSNDETSRFHHTARRRGGVAARGARAAVGKPAPFAGVSRLSGIASGHPILPAINVNWLTHARACVLFSQPGRPHPRHGGDSGDLVSQAREKPNARSQTSFDQSESEPDSQAARRSGTAARIMQARTRGGAGAADRDLGGTARNLQLANRSPIGAGGNCRKRRSVA